MRRRFDDDGWSESRCAELIEARLVTGFEKWQWGGEAVTRSFGRRASLGVESYNVGLVGVFRKLGQMRGAMALDSRLWVLTSISD